MAITTTEDCDDCPAWEEEDSAVFLNATAGLFYPSCHLHLPALPPRLQWARLGRVVTWQRRLYQAQILVINTGLLLVLAVIFYLVTISTSFNYNSNILEPWWFHTVLGLVVVAGLVSLSLGWQLGRAVSPYHVAGLLLAGLTTLTALLSLSASLAPARPALLLVGGGGTGRLQLVSLPGRSSLPSSAPAPPTISASLHTDCSLLAGTNLTGRVVVVNTSNPECSLLLQDRWGEPLQYCSAAVIATAGSWGSGLAGRGRPPPSCWTPRPGRAGEIPPRCPPRPPATPSCCFCAPETGGPTALSSSPPPQYSSPGRGWGGWN